MQKEKVYRVNGWRLLAVLLFVLLAFTVLSGFGIYFMWRAEGHLVLRQAHNVWTGLRMLGVEYYGSNEEMYDFTTRSGLTPGAETQLRRLTACEGEVMVMESTEDRTEPAKMIYREGNYMVSFYLDEQGERQWEVFRINSLFDLNGSESRHFE